MGGVNAILSGAPIMTFVHDRAAENIKRLLHRRELTPGESRLSGLGHQLLVTKYGMLHVLGTIGTGRGYEELLPFARSIEIGADRVDKVLSAEALLEEKMRQMKNLISIAWLQEIIRHQG